MAKNARKYLIYKIIGECFKFLKKNYLMADKDIAPHVAAKYGFFLSV